MTIDELAAWLDRYFEAWASNDPADVAALFAPDATYAYGPFRDPTRGRDAIVSEWISGGVGSGLSWRHEPLAVTGSLGIAHWAVSFADPASGAAVEMDGMLLADFDGAGRCVRFQEWYVKREDSS